MKAINGNIFESILTLSDMCEMFAKMLPKLWKKKQPGEVIAHEVLVSQFLTQERP